MCRTICLYKHKEHRAMTEITSCPIPQDPKVKRKKMALWFSIICGSVFVIAFAIYWFYLRFIAYTDDAYVEGNQVYITPLHDGFLTAIHTDDTYLVKRGELLVELDETDSKIALEQAQENLAQTVRQVCQMMHTVFAYLSDIEVKRAEFIRAAQDFEHRENVIEAGGVSVEDLEHATAALRSNFFSLQMTEILFEKSLAAVQGTSISSHPLVKAAADKVRDAWVHLYRCKIYSPVDGLASQRKIQVGMYVKAGQPLLSIIPLDQIWVNANFKETQLKKMKIGQKATIRSDLYGTDVLYHGTIVGLPGAAGNAFSLLPPQNLSGNWIKIVQRLPVRISLDPTELTSHPLRIGLSLEAFVDLKDQTGNLVPTTTAGSPLYETAIFTLEEKGDEEFIHTIIDQNLDPVLSEFKTQPLLLNILQDDTD